MIRVYFASLLRTSSVSRSLVQTLCLRVVDRGLDIFFHVPLAVSRRTQSLYHATLIHTLGLCETRHCRL